MIIKHEAMANYASSVMVREHNIEPDNTRLSAKTVVLESPPLTLTGRAAKCSDVCFWPKSDTA
jgi:hypothetical protein